MSGISALGRVELTKVIDGGRFVRTPDAAARLGIDADSAAKKLARWTELGWLRRIRRGLYLAVPVDAPSPASWTEDALIVANEVWDCYFTGWTAAGHWALTDQIFRTTVLRTTAKVRLSSVSLLDHDYLLLSNNPGSMSWGLTSDWRDGTRLRFADPARVVVEILDSPRISGGLRHGAEILREYLDDHDPAALVSSAERWGNRSVFKRLGYCLEVLDMNLPDVVRTCHERISTGVTALDPTGAPGGPIVSRWGLRINVTVGEEPS